MAVTGALTVGSNTASRAVTIDTTATAGTASSGSIPLQAAGPAGTASPGLRPEAFKCRSKRGNSRSKLSGSRLHEA